VKHKIAVTTSSFAKYDPAPVELLNKSGFEIVLNPFGRKLKKHQILRLCADCVGVLAGTETYDSDILGKFFGLKAISRCGAGIDNIDLEAAKKSGVKVFNTPEGPTVAVAELTIGLILGLLRKIPLMDREIRKGSWSKKMGNLLHGKRVGIIGFGKIGRKVGELLKALGTDVFYTDPFVNEKEVPGYRRAGFEELLKKSDIITLHIPHSGKNHNLLGRNEFDRVKKGTFLINCSRGGVVDEKALCGALKEGRIAAAAVDVFEREPYNGPLKDFDNVILTPHVGSYARESRIKMELEAAENLIKGLVNGDYAK